jgi:hypothetical protein
VFSSDRIHNEKASNIEISEVVALKNQISVDEVMAIFFFIAIPVASALHHPSMRK